VAHTHRRVERLRGLMSEVADEVNKELAPAGLPDGAIHTELYVQMAYGGQNSDMSVPCPEGLALNASGLLDLTQRFHDLHEADRGFAFRNQQPQVRGVRLIARGETTKPGHLAELGTVADASAAQKGARPVYWGTEFVDTPVYDGRVLGASASIDGPALVELGKRPDVVAADQGRLVGCARNVLVDADMHEVSKPTELLARTERAERVPGAAE